MRNIPFFRRQINFLLGLGSSTKLLMFLALFGVYQDVLAISQAIPFPAIIGRNGLNKVYNPAALVFIPYPQLLLSGSYYSQDRVFKGTTINSGVGIGPIYRETGESKATPSPQFGGIFVSYPFNKQLFFSLLIVQSHELALDYPADGVTRYGVTNFKEYSTDIIPSVAYKINQQYSIGAGLDYDYLRDKLNSKVRTQPLTINDSSFLTNVDRWNLGFHAGVVAIFNKQTRAGLYYRTPIIARLTGRSQFTRNGSSRFLPPMVVSNDAKVVLPFPTVLTGSFMYVLTKRFDMIATAEFSGWQLYRNNRNYKIATPGGVRNIIFPRNLQNSWYYSLIGRYQATEKAKIIGSVIYNESPADAQGRTMVAVFPNFLGYSLGLDYIFNKNFEFSMNALHIVKKTSKIDESSRGNATSNVLIGYNTINTNIISGILTYNFV